MAGKQMSSFKASPDTNLEKLLNMKLHDLQMNYSDARLKQLLTEHGLDKMPFTLTTRNVLLKKLAHKMLNMSPEHCSPASASNSADTATIELVRNNSGDATANDRVQCDNTADLCKTLTEARDSLLSCLNKTHYVVCIPNSNNPITILSDFQDVQKLMKGNKNHSPRMFLFQTLAEAETFAHSHTASEVCQGATIKSHYPQEKAEVEITELKLFPSLTTPQLNEFRIFLEKGNIGAATQCILANPRFLIQSIDVPTIVKEGPRYNALHASVIAGQLESCRLVMEMISDVEYLKRLYDTQEKAEENSRRLIDLYLNTPDKVANKTPLHFASEKGYVDIVAFLVSFNVCIRNFNRHTYETVMHGDEQTQQVLVTGETPEEVACSRYTGPNAASLKAKIVSLIQGGICYVPLIRSDTTGDAKVGDPYTPSSPYKLVSEIEDVLRPAATVNLDFVTKDFRNMKVWAFAGPMSPREGENFKKKWKSPTLAKLNHSVREHHKILDEERGFERNGRELADYYSTSWQEYWPFLDAFADLRSDEGLDKLNLFFQKQEVIHFLQALLRGEAFLSAEQYEVSKEYILTQDLSEGDESEEENEGYFSADSPSLSEEDILDSSEVSTITEDASSHSSTVTAAKPSGGVLSSLWGGVLKLVDIFSPRFGRRKQNVNSSSHESGTNAEQELSEKPPVTGTDSPPSTCSSHTSSGGDIYVLAATDVSQSIETTQPQDVTLTNADGGTQLNVQSSDLTNSSFQCQECVQDVTNSLSGAGLLVQEDADMDLSSTPDKWKYRTFGMSPVSNSPSPQKAFSGDLSSPCSDQDEMSPAYRHTKNVHRLDAGVSNSPQDRTPSGKQGSCDPHLDDSFNTKMDSFSNTLQKFSILSPAGSPSVSATPTSSTPSSRLSPEPCVHIFTGKMFSKFVSELKSRKYTDASIIIPEDPSELPTVFLRQADDSTVLADIFLPVAQRTDESWLRSRGHILDELMHKEVIKNVWVNFLVIFSSPDDAKSIAGLSQDAVVSAVIEGVPEDKDTCNVNSYGRVDSKSLKEMFSRSKDSLTDSKNTFTLCVRIARSVTLPLNEVFICGTIPTKVDADVYHALNSRACKLIRRQPKRFSHVLQWYEKMSKQGTDSISRLPSPSRVLRSERREPPPLSPLVSTPLQPSSRQPDSIASSARQMQSDSVVRNLFSQDTE
ncbi:hypothetical protein BsWGS_18345 [Bradybaena similaris]